MSWRAVGAVHSITLTLAPALDIKQRLADSKSEPPVKGSFAAPAVCVVGKPASRAAPCMNFRLSMGQADSKAASSLRTPAILMP